MIKFNKLDNDRSITFTNKKQNLYYNKNYVNVVSLSKYLIVLYSPFF